MVAYLLNDKKKWIVGNFHFSFKMSLRKKLQLKCGGEVTKNLRKGIQQSRKT